MPTLTRRRSLLALGSFVAGSSLVVTGLVSGPAGAATTKVKIGPTSGSVGTTIRVSGVCDGDTAGMGWTNVQLALYYRDAFELPMGLKSSIESSLVKVNAVTGKFTGTIKVPRKGTYTKAGPGPATPGREVSRTVRSRDRLGVEIGCMISGLSAHPIDLVHRDDVFTVGAAAKKFTLKKKPAIKGKRAVGKKLRATKGKWSPKPTSFSYQWKRGKKAIAGATKRKYKVKAKDAGKKLRVIVTVDRDGYQARSKASKKVKIKR